MGSKGLLLLVSLLGWFLRGPLGYRLLFSQEHIQVIRIVGEIAERSLPGGAEVKVNATVVRHAEGNDVLFHTLASIGR